MSIQYSADQLQRKFRDAPRGPGFPRIAEALRGDGKLDEAIAVCQEGLGLRPDQLSGYLVLGKCLVEAGRLEEAREQYESALKLDSRCLSALHALAGIMSKLQWQDAAAGYYRSILAVEPWDAEVQALLGPASEAPPAHETGGYAPGPAASQGAMSPYAPPGTSDLDDSFPHSSNADVHGVADPGTGTLQAAAIPGAESEVIEFDINDAARFMPQEEAESPPGDMDSLEEALAALPDDDVPSPGAESREPEPMAGATTIAGHTTAAATVPEPMPLDILKDETYADIDGDGNNPAPISGEDVQDRLDSLFGLEDGETRAHAAPASDDFGSGPAPGETTFAASETSYTSSDQAASETAFSAAQTAFVEKKPPDTFGAVRADAETGFMDISDEAGRVSGEDIENRLDALFSLGDEQPASAAGDTVFASAAPADTSFMDADTSFAASDTSFAAASEDAVAASPTRSAEETQEAFLADSRETAALTPEEASITGQDVADKLEALFGADKGDEASRDEAILAQARPSATDEFPIRELEQDGRSTDMLTTESLFPSVGLNPGDSLVVSGDAARDKAPDITGADVEAGLDRLFQTGEFAAMQPETPDKVGDSHLEEEAWETQVTPKLSQPAKDPVDAMPPPPPLAMPGDESDRTLVMPAFPDSGGETPLGETPGEEKASLREAVSDWLAHQVDLDQELPDSPGLPPEAAGATLILPAQDLMDRQDRPEPGRADMDRASEAALAEETGILEPLGYEDMAGIGDTTGMEIVDGVDIAERLDQIFGETEAPALDGLTPETDVELPLGASSLFDREDARPASTGALPREWRPGADAASGDAVVSGEEVSARLHEMFDPALETVAGDATASPPGIPSDPGLDTDETLLPMTETLPDPLPAAAGEASGASQLAPLQDEDEGYPEEEDASQTAAGANVATVTLAEIYFQQGLKEQALQIYRQLLEREPENEAVRKRIQEIEASKPDGEGSPGGPDQRNDPLRPRPGLKVPKRKK